MEFAELSGLRANPSKSTVFYSGISLTSKEMLLDCFGMKEGKLRVRYLGCPLDFQQAAIFGLWSFVGEHFKPNQLLDG